MNDIIAYLEKLDLSTIEAKLYIALLESGSITVRELAHKVAISRTTSYPYINSLIEKGLVTKMVMGSKTLVIANPPRDTLQHLLQQKDISFQNMKEKLPQIIKSLNASLPERKDESDDRIEYYKGTNSITKIFKALLKVSELRIYTNFSEIESLLSTNPKLFSDLLAKNKKIKIYGIIADDFTKTIKSNIQLISQNERCTYKFMPTHKGMLASLILMYGNTLAILNTKEKVSCIMLFNVDYYINARKIFDFNWERIPETIK